MVAHIIPADDRKPIVHLKEAPTLIGAQILLDCKELEVQQLASGQTAYYDKYCQNRPGRIPNRRFCQLLVDIAAQVPAPPGALRLSNVEALMQFFFGDVLIVEKEESQTA